MNQKINAVFSATTTAFTSAVSRIGSTVDKVAGDFDRSAKAMQQSINNTANKVNESAEKISGGLQAVGGAFTPLSVGFAALGAAGVKAYTEIEGASKTFQTKLGLSGKELEQYESKMKNVAKTGVGSFEEVSNAMVSVTNNMKNLKPDELESITETAMQLANVMDVEVAEVTRSAGTLMTQFGMDGEKAMDLITKGYQSGLDFSGEYLDSLNEYSVHFKTMGFSAEDMFNIMINGAQEGAWNLDKIGDAIKEANIRMKDGSKGTDDAFKALGLNAEQMGSDFAAGGDKAQAAFTAVMAGLSQVTNEQERNELGVALFGTQYEDLEKDVVASFGNIENSLGDYNGAAQELVENNKTFTQEMQGAWNSIALAIQPIGEAIANLISRALPPIISFVQQVSEKFQSLSPTMQNVVLAFGGIVAIIPIIVGALAGLLAFVPLITGGFTTLTAIVPLVTGVFVKLVSAFKLVGTAFNALRVLLVANPFGAIILAITVLVPLIISNWDTIKEYLIKVWDFISVSAEKIWSSISSALSVIWEGIKKVASVVFDGLKLYFTTIFNVYKTIITTVFDGIKLYFTTIFNVYKTLFTTVFDFIKTYITTVFNVYKTIITTVWDAISKGLSVTWNAIKTTAQTVFNALKTVITTIFNGIKTTITTIWDAISKGLTITFNAIKTSATTIWNALKTFFTTTVNAIKTTVENAFNTMKNTSINTFNLLKSGASTAFNAVKDAMTKPVEAAKDAIKKAIDAVKGFFSGLTLKFPKIQMPQLPKFTLTGDFSLNPPSVPKIGLKWFANGGIINGTKGGTVVGVGENHGTEAIVPLSNKAKMKPFAQAVSGMINQDSRGGNNGDGQTVIQNTFNINGNNLNAQEIANEVIKIQNEQARKAGVRNNGFII